MDTKTERLATGRRITNTRSEYLTRREACARGKKDIERKRLTRKVKGKDFTRNLGINPKDSPTSLYLANLPGSIELVVKKFAFE